MLLSVGSPTSIDVQSTLRAVCLFAIWQSLVLAEAMRAHTILISAWLLNVVAIVLTQGLDPITDMCIRFDQQCKMP